MWVKICGTTTHQDARLALSAGANAIGFVFAPSKRQVNAEQVAAITSALPENVEKVGVFAATSADEIVRKAQMAGLTAVQLHFAYDAAAVALIGAALGPGLKLLQVISCSVDELNEAELRAQLASALNDPQVWGILLDSSAKGASGGTGRSFDWARAARVLHEAWPQRTSGQGPKLILAGGLHAANVRDAIRELLPYGVDVVSGVEREPGKKDPVRLQAFAQAAKAT